MNTVVANSTHFPIYVYLNNIPILALNERTAAGIANAMRCSKDKAGDVLKGMCAQGLLVYEPVGNSRVYYVNNDDSATPSHAVNDDEGDQITTDSDNTTSD